LVAAAGAAIVSAMPSSPPDPPAPPELRPSGGGLRRSAFAQALGLPSIGVALVLGLLAAHLLKPIFVVPFGVVLSRTLFLALLLLLVHAAARQWRPGWLPRWMPAWTWPVAAVALAALPATLLIYLLTLKGDVAALAHPARLWGIAFIAGSGLALGLLAAIFAGVRERLAQARSRELQFELERSRLEKQAVDARLALLQAQIEPHFLFNTLANVQALVEAGSPRAPEVLKSLIAYLRAALPRLHEGTATLAQELDLVRAYLELMRMRMPDRLQFDITADPALQQRAFPPMALLTLVENAVRHGIDPLEQGGRIEVQARRETGHWLVVVNDDGAGLDPRHQPGTGLANLRERLLGFFGPGAALQLEERSPHGLGARIIIPDASPART
jgi:two-component sensor histidine kinase